MKKFKLEIRLKDSSVKDRFKMFVLKGKFRDYEDALVFLLEYGEKALEAIRSRGA